MRVLLAAVGSAGNVLPFIGWGKALRARGHEVFLLGDVNSRALAQREGLEFVSVDEPGAVEGQVRPRPSATFQLLGQFVDECRDLTPRVYRAIRDCRIPGRTVVASHTWLIGRIAQQRLGVPLATVHLQPMMFGNLYEPGMLNGRLGLCFRRLRQRLIDRVLNRRLGEPLNEFRRSLGLSPVRSFREWLCSPDLVVGMFPAWFSPPRPDWPPQTCLAGFPRFDRLEEPRDLAQLDAFLNAGSPPLVFSHPTLLKAEGDYFATAADIAGRLGRRAILLSALAAEPATPLPPGVRHFGFVPLSRVLPRAAALVHHGGMGTLSQALAAGIPQLTVPKFLDQPDNSRRLERLGVSVIISPRQYRPEVVAAKLRHLLESDEVRKRCRHYADLSRGDDCFATASAALEGLLQETSGSPVLTSVAETCPSPPA